MISPLCFPYLIRHIRYSKRPITIPKDDRMKKNIQQRQNPDKTFKMQEIGLLQKPRRLLFLGPLLIGIIGFVLLFWCTSNYGVGLSGDSVGYITWARNLLENHSFSKQDGSFLLSWPPLYPILIACLKLCGTNEFFAARLMSTISFGLIIFFSGLWILKYSGSLTFSVIGSICTLLSKPLFGVCCWAWSEPLFILFIIAFLLLVPDIISKPTFKSTLLLAVVTSAACMIRYIGIVLLPIGAVVLFFGIKHFRKKLIFTAFWGVVSLLLPGIWFLRNRILTGTFFGARPAAIRTFNENIQLTGNTIGSWFIPSSPQDSVSGWLFFILFCIFISAIFVFIAYKIMKSKEFDWSLITVSLFIFLYLTAIIYAVTTVSMDSIDDRFLSPLYPAVVFILWAFISNLLGPGLKLPQVNNYYVRRTFRYGLIIGIGLSIWLITGLNFTAASAQYLSNKGLGMSSSTWKNSETIAWLKANRPKGRIYTNDPQRIYILADIDAYMVPTKLDYFKNLSPADQNSLEQQIPKFKSALESKEDVYLVWFFSHFRKCLYDPQELQQFCNMKIIKELDDGIIIALYPKELSNSSSK